MSDKIFDRFYTDRSQKNEYHTGLGLSIAKKMALQAKKAGADIVKFQHHLPDEEMLPIVPKSKNLKASPPIL